MNEQKPFDRNAMMQVAASWRLGHLTRQEYRTLRGQILAGDVEAALKGLRKILSRR